MFAPVLTTAAASVVTDMRCCYGFNLTSDLSLDVIEILTPQQGLLCFFRVAQTDGTLLLRKLTDAGEHFRSDHNGSLHIMVQS